MDMCLYVRVCYNSQFMIGVLSEFMTFMKTCIVVKHLCQCVISITKYGLNSYLLGASSQVGSIYMS